MATTDEVHSGNPQHSFTDWPSAAHLPALIVLSQCPKESSFVYTHKKMTGFCRERARPKSGQLLVLVRRLLQLSFLLPRTEGDQSPHRGVCHINLWLW